MRTQFCKNEVFTNKDFDKLCKDIAKHKKVKSISLDRDIWGVSLSIHFVGVKKPFEYYLSTLDNRYSKCMFILLTNVEKEDKYLTELINSALYNNTIDIDKIISSEKLQTIRRHINNSESFRIYIKKMYQEDLILVNKRKDKIVLTISSIKDKPLEFNFSESLNIEEFNIINLLH